MLRPIWALGLGLFSLAISIPATQRAVRAAECPLEQPLQPCAVSCPINNSPPETRNCTEQLTINDQTHRVIGFSCTVNSSSCSSSATLCELSTSTQSSVSATDNCPNPCVGGCPGGYTQNCIGDQQPDPNQCDCCVNPSPIALDLGGDQLSFSSAAEGVLWDINGRGAVFRLGWPVDPSDDGFLALDRNTNGRIDDGSELFGNATPLRGGRTAAHGYEALAELDENADGWVDSSDSAFVKLRLWRDFNRNGITDHGELSDLETYGVRRLSTQYEESKREDEHGNRFLYRARTEFSTRPHVRFSYDVFPVWQRK